jgi:hypothetical protein
LDTEIITVNHEADIIEGIGEKEVSMATIIKAGKIQIMYLWDEIIGTEMAKIGGLTEEEAEL